MQTSAARKDAHRASDVEIIQRVLAGDRNVFELLMRRYNRPLYRTARSIVRDDAEAEDVLQEAYLLAFHNLPTFRGASTLLTWLTRIVVNNAIARSRKMARCAQIIVTGCELDWETHSASSSIRLNLPEQPEQATERSEMRRLIEVKIDDLPDAFRTVFMLRALEEMSVEDTAACLGIPEATVRTRYFRAKGLLREALSREIDFALEGAFSFDGARCDRIVYGVLASLTDASAGGS
jgi:RNA polymerase sigma-70 factor (ECF subfamily)